MYFSSFTRAVVGPRRRLPAVARPAAPLLDIERSCCLTKLEHGLINGYAYLNMDVDIAGVPELQACTSPIRQPFQASSGSYRCLEIENYREASLGNSREKS